MADETLNLNVTATLVDLQKELAKIPGITEKEAKGMVNALSGNLKRAQQAASQAARRMNSDMSGAFNDMKQGAGAVFGGIVNDIDDVIAGLGGLSATVGPVGTAIGGIALGAAVGVGALMALESAALGAADALAEAGMPIDPALVASIEDANAAMGAFGLAFKSVVATLGGIFGPLLSETIQLTLSFGYAIGDLVGFTGQARVSLTGLVQFLGGALVEAINLASRGILFLGDAAVAVGDAFGLSTGKLKFYVSMMEMKLDRQVEAAHAYLDEINLLDLVDDRVTNLMSTSMRMVQARHTSTQATVQETEAVSDLTSMYEHLDQAMQQSMRGSAVNDAEQWAETTSKLSKELEYNSQAVTANNREMSEYAQSVSTYAGITAQVVDSAAQLIQQSQEQTAAAAGKLAQSAADARDAAIDAYREARAEYEANAESMTHADRQRMLARLQGLQREVRATKRAAKETSEAEKDALMRGFRAQQATAAVQAVIQSAINFGSLIPAVAPSAGIWAPAVAGGIAAGVLTLQLATILSQAPPAFYTGGMAPGETTAVLHQGESVLNRRATQALGPDVINAINQGRQQMAGSATTVVNLDGRLLATIGREGRRRDSPMPTRLGSMYGVG